MPGVGGGEKKNVPSELHGRTPGLGGLSLNHQVPDPVPQHLEGFGIPRTPRKASRGGPFGLGYRDASIGRGAPRRERGRRAGRDRGQEAGAPGLTGARCARERNRTCSVTAAECRAGRAARRYMRAHM